MAYNIEFQVSGLIVVLILLIVFFAKERFHSLQNSIYRVLLIITVIELLLDIASVITITNREMYPRLNKILSKGYLIAMLSYIGCIALYTLSNTLYPSIPHWRRRSKQIQAIIIILGYIACCIIVFATELLYGGDGKFIYSYGPASDTVYMYSTISVVYVIAVLLINIKNIPPMKQLSIYSFCIMEGIVAIVQMFNKELLIIGFGTAAAMMIMYFTLENPDMKMIKALNNANQKNRELLLNILPESVADRLKDSESTFTEKFQDVTIMFLDLVNFSKLSNEIGAQKIVFLLNKFFSQIDDLLSFFKVEKIKTMGDCYMAAAGIPDYYDDNQEEMVKFAFAVLKLLDGFNKRNGTNIQVRIGLNTGPVVAGIIGKKKFIYDLWGEAVNLASRMESYGVPDRINVSPYLAKKLESTHTLEKQPVVDIKGFGDMETYLICK